MKNILFTLFAILILTSCSKDEEDWTELNSNNIMVIGRQESKVLTNY